MTTIKSKRLWTPSIAILNAYVHLILLIFDTLLFKVGTMKINSNIKSDLGNYIY